MIERKCSDHRRDLTTMCKRKNCLQDTWAFSIYPSGWCEEDFIQILIFLFPIRQRGFALCNWRVRPRLPYGLSADKHQPLFESD